MFTKKGSYIEQWWETTFRNVTYWLVISEKAVARCSRDKVAVRDIKRKYVRFVAGKIAVSCKLCVSMRVTENRWIILHEGGKINLYLRDPPFPSLFTTWRNPRHTRTSVNWSKRYLRHVSSYAAAARTQWHPKPRMFAVIRILLSSCRLFFWCVVAMSWHVQDI